MITKRVLCPERLRHVPQRFSWIDQRLVRDDHIARCGPQALALYLLLVTVKEFLWVLAVTVLKQHFESLQIVIHCLCRDLANQRMSESYDILFYDFADGLIRPLTEKLHKLR
jgi:hypothetical protein